MLLCHCFSAFNLDYLTTTPSVQISVYPSSSSSSLKIQTPHVGNAERQGVPCGNQRELFRKQKLRCLIRRSSVFDTSSETKEAANSSCVEVTAEIRGFWRLVQLCVFTLLFHAQSYKRKYNFWRHFYTAALPTLRLILTDDKITPSLL